MGAAKRRGTHEQRVTAALQKNTALQQQVAEGKLFPKQEWNKQCDRIQKQRGTQHLWLMLITSGLLKKRTTNDTQI